MNRTILLLSVLLAFCFPSYGSSGINISNAKLCKGESLNLVALATDIPPSTIIEGWFLNGVKLTNTIVQPQVTTTYELRSSLAGLTSSDYASIEVKDKPKITLTSPLKVCEGNSIQLTVATKENTDHIVFRDINTGIIYPENTNLTPSGNMTLEVSASNTVCVGSMDLKTMTIEILKLKDPNSLKIEPYIYGNACETCEVNLNEYLKNNLKHNGDSISAYTYTWPNVTDPEHVQIPATPYQSVNYSARVNAIVYATNACGTTFKNFTNHPLIVSLEINPCIPALSNVVNACICDKILLELTNPNIQKCKFDENNIYFTASTGDVPVFKKKVIGNNAQYFSYETVATDNSVFTASIDYTLSCPTTEKQEQIVLSKSATTKECPPSVDYYYCKGDTAYFQITADLDRQKIRNPQILGNHANLFRQVGFDDHSIVFVSKDTVIDSLPYSPLSYSYEYYDANCDTVFEKSGIQALASENCLPTTLLTYPKYTASQYYACKGDTIQFRVEDYGRAVNIDSIIFQRDPAFSISLIRKEENPSTPGVSLFYYRIFAYKTFDLKLKIYFKEAGFKNDISLVQKITVADCGASLMPLIGDNACPGSNIETAVILQNPTSHLTKPLAEAIKWNNNPPVEMEYLRREYYPPYQYYYYKTKTPPQTKTTFRVKVFYNQGDSLYETQVPERVANTPECRPYVYSSDYSLCRGEEMRFFVNSTNPNDSIFSIEWANSSEYPIVLVDKPSSTSFEFQTYASKDTTYKVKIRAYNQGTIREYIDSSISVRVYAQPRSFISDKIVTCRGTSVDLRAYENKPPNEGGIKTILYPGNNFVFNHHNSAYFQVQTESHYLCKWMEGDRVYIDSIFVQVDSTLWATVMKDTTVCQYSKVQLFGNTNGTLTWRKNGIILYEEVPVDSVVYDIVNEASEYEIIFQNACGRAQRKLNIDIVAAPLLEVLPYDEICIFDSISLSVLNHACLPESIYWTYTHDSLSKEERIEGDRIVDLPLHYSDTTYFYAHGMGFNACPMKSLCKVMVYPLPEVRLTVNGDSVMCAKGETRIVLDASGAQVYYFPQFNCSTCSSVRTLVDTTTVYVVKGTDVHGCSSEGRFYFIRNHDVLSVRDTGFCDRRDFMLTADSLENAVYRWFDPENTLFSEDISMYIPTADVTDTGVYTLYTSRFICRDTNRVRLFLKPTPTARMEKNTAPLCEGSPLFLGASTDMATADNYWLLNDSSLYTASLMYNKNPIQASDAGYYQFISSLDQCADTLTVYVRVDTHTQPIFTELNPYYCEGDNIQLIAQPLHDSIQYIWKTNTREFVTKESAFSFPSIQLSENTLCLYVQKYTCLDSICEDLEVRMRPNPTIVAEDFYCESEDVFIYVEDTVEGGFSEWIYQTVPLSNQSGFTLPNIQLSDSGLYVYIHTFNGCRNYPDSLQLKVRPLPVIDFGSVDYVCEGSDLLLDVDREGGTYLWSTGSIDARIFVKDSAWYWVDVTENQCSFKDSIYISLRPLPLVNLGNDSIICYGDVVNLYGPLDADTYLWQDDSRASEYQVSKEGLYWLKAEQNSCSHTDSVYLTYKYCGRFYLPNAFTPNGDGVNDEFKVILQAHRDEIDFNMWIYDRNGKLLFESNDFDRAWDGYYKGKLCHSGVYICKVKIVDKRYNEVFTKTISINLLN